MKAVMNTCRGCNLLKDLSAFSVRNDRSGRLRPYCKVCSADAQRARYTSYRRTQPFKHRAMRAKARARLLKVPYDLTPEYLESIWTGYCPVLGVPVSLDTEREMEFAVELDRFTPSLGYVRGNVAFLSRRANRLKNSGTLEDFVKLCDWMRKYESNVY